jgi:glycosyltransferase involved in cell wall biosynthesis
MCKSLPQTAHRILIYIPTYNCRERTLALIDEIPRHVWNQADVMVIDNQSQDGTLEALRSANQARRWPHPIHLVQPNENLGYAGSQKLAYNLVLMNEKYEWVLMLHGDGQYDPNQLDRFFAHLYAPNDVVYGYRSWRKFWSKDETPWSSYITIKTLSLLESLITGFWRKEWHSGMVMYHRRFLSRIYFANITTTMHIDGHLLYASGKFGCPVTAVPIYKRYKNYPAIGRTARVRYVFDVLRLLPRMKSIPIERTKSAKLSYSELARVEQSYVHYPIQQTIDL